MVWLHVGESAVPMTTISNRAIPVDTKLPFLEGTTFIFLTLSRYRHDDKENKNCLLCLSVINTSMWCRSRTILKSYGCFLQSLASSVNSDFYFKSANKVEIVKPLTLCYYLPLCMQLCQYSLLMSGLCCQNLHCFGFKLHLFSMFSTVANSAFVFIDF